MLCFYTFKNICCLGAHWPTHYNHWFSVKSFLGSVQGATVCHGPASDAPLWCSQQSVQWRLKQKCEKCKFKAAIHISASDDGTGFHVFVCIPSERRPWFRGITVRGHIVVLEVKRICPEWLPFICGRLGGSRPTHIVSVRLDFFSHPKLSRNCCY